MNVMKELSCVTKTPNVRTTLEVMDAYAMLGIPGMEYHVQV